MDTVMKFIEIIILLRARCSIGVGPSGNWMVKKGEQVFEAERNKSLLPFVSCLEEPIGELRANLVAGLAAKSLDVGYEAKFPYADIVAEGIAMRSQKWISLGINWLDDRLPNIKPSTEYPNTADKGECVNGYREIFIPCQR